MNRYYIKSNFLFKSVIFISFCVISIFGMMNIYAASKSVNGITLVFFQKQLIFFILSLFLIFYIKKYCIQFFYRYAYIFMGIVLFMLVLLMFFGTGRGTNRWINLGIINIQPSEFAKISLIFGLSRYFYNLKGEINLHNWIVSIILVVIVFIAVLLQPDLGTAIITFLCGSSILFFAGMPARFFVISAILFFCMLPISWKLLHSYQRERIMTLIFDSDPLGAGYQIFQSKIAIGSGGLFGKGFLNGTQSALNFLPEKRTDFIFALMCEEWGFFGAFLLIVLYSIIIFGGLYLGIRKQNLFHKFIIMSCSILIFSHVFINIGMVTGILPVVGVPLPLMSYGGSSFLIFSTSIGIIISEEKYLSFS